MSRRPLGPPGPEYKAAFSVGRMAPGGRRWSESPIPRVAQRRVKAGKPADPVAPTFVDRDQWIPYLAEDNPFEIHDGGTYSPAFGTFDKALCWVYCYTTTFTPPSGWTTLLSGTYDGVQYWVGWVDGAGAGTDWTLTFAAAPGYPEGYRTTHVWCEYLNGGNMEPVVQSVDMAMDVSSLALPGYAGLELPRQVQWLFGKYETWGRWGADYNYKTFFSTVAPEMNARDFWEYGAGLRSGSHSWFSDSGRTTPLALDTVISFAVGWAQP